jgi:hypothetical protein
MFSDADGTARPRVADSEIRALVEQALTEGVLQPMPLPGFNPPFERRQSVAEFSGQRPVSVNMSQTVKGYALSVYTSLDQGSERVMALDPSVAAKMTEERRPIYANVFSRASGASFICVSKRRNRLEPRELHELSHARFASGDGYLIIGEGIWDPRDDIQFLPEAWLHRTWDGYEAKAEMKAFFPEKLYFNEFGECSDNDLLPWWGWFMKAPLLFDPTDLPPEPFPRLVPRQPVVTTTFSGRPSRPDGSTA